MGLSAVTLSEKIMQLSDSQLAEVDRFVDVLRLREDNGLVKASMALSEPSLEAIWNNPEDEVYDAL